MLAVGSTPAFAQVAAAPLSPAKQLLEQGADIKFDPFSVLVRFDIAADPAAIERAIAMVDGRVLEVYDLVPGLVHLEIGVPVDRAIAALNQVKCVRYAEPDWVCKTSGVPNDPNFGNLWGMRNTGQTVNGDPGVSGADSRAHLAWDSFTGSPSFVVAIIDDGTSRTHPDLAANIWSNPGEIAGDGIDNDTNGYVDDTWGYDFYQRDSDPTGTGHGTHTAGTVGAVGNNGVGVAGVMWNCKLMALRFIGANGGLTSDAITRALAAPKRPLVEPVGLENEPTTRENGHAGVHNPHGCYRNQQKGSGDSRPRVENHLQAHDGSLSHGPEHRNRHLGVVVSILH